MKRFDWMLLLILSVVLPVPVVSAMPDDDAVEELTYNFTRENPDFDTDRENLLDSIDLSDFRFLNLKANKIELNGADWSRVTSSLADCDRRPMRIVHIGDSHIQADMATGYTRRILQQEFGDAGRGLIVPLKLASTNEPLDYAITSTSQFDVDKLLSHDWKSRMGFTGVSLTPKSSEFDFTIRANEDFERLYIYYNGASLNLVSVEYQGKPLVCGADDSPGCLEIGLPFPCNEITVNLTAFGKVSVYGMELLSDILGVTYNAIGINGATYSSYNRIEDFGRSIANLEPDLIIISLGTNEAFGRVDSNEISSQIDALVTDLRHNNPDAGIVLITPAECHRRVRQKRRTSFVVNQQVAAVRKILLDYAADHGIAVYDLYDVAGGDGSSTDWIAHDLFSRDHIHYSHSGYELVGRLLYEALINSTLSDNHK